VMKEMELLRETAVALKKLFDIIDDHATPIIRAHGNDLAFSRLAMVKAQDFIEYIDTIKSESE
jgi:hypothetical protein